MESEDGGDIAPDLIEEQEEGEAECPQSEEIYPIVGMFDHARPAGYETVQDGDIIEVEGKKARVKLIKLPPAPSRGVLFLRGFLKIGVASAIVIAGILLQGSGIGDLSTALCSL